ncbi:MAG TPA: tripartite tricarboxylate transporter permease [Methanomassiliicoccales archaeon]|nr:tripartite tricarboxylate transporter permease [Methanomassiliicoccales archaeon]
MQSDCNPHLERFATLGNRVDIPLLLMIVYSTFLGSMLGSVSGLIPGIHVNTLALVLLAMEPWLENLMGGVLSASDMEPGIMPLMISSIIVSAAVVHSFLDFIPSIFLGAPDSSQALSVLPGHRMLMSGNGLEAVLCSAKGSLIGALLAVLIATPSQLVMGPPLEIYDEISPWIPLILLGVVIFLIISERNGGWRSMSWAVAISLSSGLLGFIVLNANLPLGGMIGMGQSLLFPLLTGLFGLPTLLLSLDNPSIPEQTKSLERASRIKPSIKGVLAGAMVGWFPGITSTSGAVMASFLSRRTVNEESAPNFITTVSAVGSSATVFSLIALSVTGRGRTGAMLAVADLLGEDLDLLGQVPSAQFGLLLLSALISAGLGYLLTLKMGSIFARMISRYDMGKVGKAIIILVLILVLLFNGLQGLLLLGVATLLGMIPPRVGVGRVHLTGCLLIPVMLFFLG